MNKIFLKIFFSALFSFNFLISSLAASVDKTPPVGSIKINNDADFTNSTSVILNLSATDAGSGLSQMQFSNNNFTWHRSQSYRAAAFWVLSSGNGAKTVYVKYKDKAGNWSEPYSASIVLDASPPTTPVVTDDGTTTASVTQLHAVWSSSDPVSGISEYQYMITRNSPFGVPVVRWASTGTVSEVTRTGLSLTSNKAYYFLVKAKNKAGLWSKIGYSNGIRLVIPTQDLPVINSITPPDNSIFLAGAKISIQINARGPDNGPLEYQFSIGGTIKQPWSNLNTCIWQTADSDTGTVNIVCQVRGDQNRETLKSISYSIINPAIQDVLKKVADNYANINDLKADMELSSTLDGQPFGEAGYCRYYFKAPDKEKTETFSNAMRRAKTDVIITVGSKMHLVDPLKRTTQSIDLLTESNITGDQFNQLDLYYDQGNFINSHVLTENYANSDFNNAIITLDAVPQTPNNIYTKLELYIDYNKGLVTKIIYYKNEELPQIMEAQETKQMPNGTWVISKLKKTPNLQAGSLTVVLRYANLQINTGLADAVFDPSKQY